MDLFDQIESAKKDLPKVKNISKDLKKRSLKEMRKRSENINIIL